MRGHHHLQGVHVSLIGAGDPSTLLMEGLDDSFSSPVEGKEEYKETLSVPEEAPRVLPSENPDWRVDLQVLMLYLIQNVRRYCKGDGALCSLQCHLGHHRAVFRDSDMCLRWMAGMRSFKIAIQAKYPAC